MAAPVLAAEKVQTGSTTVSAGERAKHTHTAGPWTASHDASGLTIECDPRHGGRIARVSRQATGKEHHNARLIAAAPDLQSALQAIIDTASLESRSDTDRAVLVLKLDAVRVIAQGALAKAEAR